MLVSGNKTLLIRCHICGRLKKYDFSVFDIFQRKPLKFKCECGETIATIKATAHKTYLLEFSCFACHEKHIHGFTLKELLHKDSLITCSDETKTCFVGSKEKALKESQESHLEYNDMIEEVSFIDYFKNFRVLSACLMKVYDLNESGRISCECGSHNISIQVFNDRIELQCMKCKSIQIIYAETDEDMNVLFQKEKIAMHKHSVSCIDSIIEKNRNIKDS